MLENIEVLDITPVFLPLSSGEDGFEMFQRMRLRTFRWMMYTRIGLTKERSLKMNREMH